MASPIQQITKGPFAGRINTHQLRLLREVASGVITLSRPAYLTGNDQIHEGDKLRLIQRRTVSPLIDQGWLTLRGQLIEATEKAKEMLAQDAKESAERLAARMNPEASHA